MIQPYPTIQFEQLKHILVDETIPTGKKLLLIGTGEKGEYYNPIMIQDTHMIETEFGAGSLLSTYEEFSRPFGPFSVYAIRTEDGQIEEAISLLKHLSFDYILFDNSIKVETHFTSILDFIDVAYEKTQKGELIHAFCSTSAKTLEEKESVYNRIESLLEWVGVEQEEKGKFITVVYDQLDEQYTAAYYAALHMSQDIRENPVNKELPTAKIKLTLSLAEEKEFTSKGIVCLKNSFHHGVIFASSTSAVQTSDSVHKSFPNFKIAQHAISIVSKTFRPFIGKSSLILDDTFVMDTLDTIGVNLINNGYIKDYSYDFSMKKVKGELMIDIDLVPIFSIYSIKSRTQMRAVQS